MRIAKLGLYIDEEVSKRRWQYGQNVFANYMSEVLDRMRIPYQKISNAEQIDHQQFEIIIAALTPDTKAVEEKILDFVKNGGSVFSLAALDQLAPYFGYRKGETVRAGYAMYDQEKYQKLRFLKAVPWNPTENAKTENVIGSLLDGKYPLFQQFSVGKGTFTRSSVDIADTIVMLQQGAEPLFEDGSPAPDGTAEINDHFLKVDDMCQMDWEQDRKFTSTAHPYFAYPYADL